MDTRVGLQPVAPYHQFKRPIPFGSAAWTLWHDIEPVEGLSLGHTLVRRGKAPCQGERQPVLQLWTPKGVSRTYKTNLPQTKVLSADVPTAAPVRIV